VARLDHHIDGPIGVPEQREAGFAGGGLRIGPGPAHFERGLELARVLDLPATRRQPLPARYRSLPTRYRPK
jgi:hypothetical protein